MSFWDVVISPFVVCIAVIVCRHLRDRALARWKVDRFSVLGEAAVESSPVDSLCG
jgi:hypothetical protein